MNQVILRIHLRGTTLDVVMDGNTAKQHIARWNLGQLGERFGDPACFAPWEVKSSEITGMQVLVPQQQQAPQQGPFPWGGGSGLN